MYQNIPQIQSNPYYQYPYAQQYQRLAQMEQQQNSNQVYGNQSASTQNYLKGRPVVSIEEARASQIDLDGSLFIFTDIGNKKIYTKQINLDGTASLNTYSLVDNAIPTEDYVTKTELNEAIASIQKKMEEREKGNESIKQQQLGSSKATVRAKPTF